MRSIRLKINIKPIDFFNNNQQLDSNLIKFWFYLNTKKLKTVEQFQDEIFKRLDLNGCLFMSRIFVQDHELPLFESTSIFRDSDIVM
jgi:hypothetical protein